MSPPGSDQLGRLVDDGAEAGVVTGLGAGLGALEAVLLLGSSRLAMGGALRTAPLRAAQGRLGEVAEGDAGGTEELAQRRIHGGRWSFVVLRRWTGETLAESCCFPRRDLRRRAESLGVGASCIRLFLSPHTFHSPELPIDFPAP